MSDHLTASKALEFVARHGYTLLFTWVLAEQSAVPLPSVPLLLAAGALIRSHRLNAVGALASCLVAALIADSVWYVLGSRKGRKVLRVLCRVSLEPDSCVRQTEKAYIRYGMRALLISKFVPGLNTVAAPMAGVSKQSYRRFAIFDSAGAIFWSATYLITGYIFSKQLETALFYASRVGFNFAVLMLAICALWIAWKYIQRRRFLARLRIARITPQELRGRLDSGEEFFIVDLRHAPADEPELIPGAVRISPDELSARSKEVPRDRDIVLVCS